MSDTINLKQLPSGALYQALAPLGVTPSMARRYSGGADIGAACGLLAGTVGRGLNRQEAR